MNSNLDISIVIAFYNQAKMTIGCVKSIYNYGPNVKEILLVSNNSSPRELELVQTYAATTPSTRVLVWDYPFNYQKEYNWAVSKTTGKYVFMLNNDIELRPKSRGLIERMYEKASHPNVGIVGCTLLYGDEKQIQHAGVYLVPEGLADHMYVREKYSEAISSTASDRFPYDITKDMPMTAVTGAAQMVEKRKFDELGGLDEKFIICGGDVDLCIRHNSAGYQTWLIGGGYMLHKESVSRKFTPIPDEDFYNSYLSYIKGYDLRVGDPFVPEITKNLKIYGA